MAIRDLLPFGRGRRRLAARLLDATREPFDRLHAAIGTAGVAQMGEGFEDVRSRFVDCRILHGEKLIDFPADEREALYRLVERLRPEFVELHADARAAFAQVHDEWRHGGLIEAAAGGGLRALDLLRESDRPKNIQGRLFHIALFMDVDVAAADVQGELKHIALAPALFW